MSVPHVSYTYIVTTIKRSRRDSVQVSMQFAYKKRVDLNYNSPLVNSFTLVYDRCTTVDPMQNKTFFMVFFEWVGRLQQ